MKKIMSKITFARILPSIKKFISHNQAAYRKGRSIEYVVWTHKMKIASTITSGKTLKIQGIDLSSAFDTMDCGRLMKVIDSICLPEDSKLVKFLLKDIKRRFRTNEEGPTFATNIGVPLGDGLSPVLFTTYSEATMKDNRKKRLHKLAGSHASANEKLLNQHSFFNAFLETLIIKISHCHICVKSSTNMHSIINLFFLVFFSKLNINFYKFYIFGSLSIIHSQNLFYIICICDFSFAFVIFFFFFDHLKIIFQL